jgi:hypothetical protein
VRSEEELSRPGRSVADLLTEFRLGGASRRIVGGLLGHWAGWTRRAVELLGLLQGVRCLDPREGLSPGQVEEIDRVLSADPHLTDDAFVAAHLDEWLRA